MRNREREAQRVRDIVEETRTTKRNNERHT
jgi:hypothetical protein